MISIARNQRDERDQPIKPPQAWFDNASLADAKILRELAVLTEGASLDFNDDVYGHEQVRRALEKLFHRKCAYCETPITTGFDVEHFRPKGRVAEDANHPGYYWLAYAWENLLPACAQCNQRRKDPPTWDDPSTGPSAGKLDQFPLEDGSFRASEPSHNLADERPLLLNPCVDNPEEHFTCNFFTGDLLPKNNSSRAATSIRVFNLNRKRLREQRQAVARRLKDELEARLDGQWPSVADPALARNFTGDSIHYAGFARILVKDPALLGIDVERHP